MQRVRGNRPAVGFISLGCPKNQVDCELMLSRADDAGFALATELEQADALVINTCAFIAAAQAEADEAIREALEQKRAGRCRAVIVAGCLPQYLQQRRHEAYPEVDAWLTPDNPGSIGEVLSRLLDEDASEELAEPERFALPAFLADAEAGRVLSTPPSLAYVKIADGCNHRCRFCIIPDLRGRYRSRPPDDVLAEVAMLSELAVPEIVLVSQDSSYYGRDLGGPRLAGLLEQLCTLDGSGWLRVMYMYPDHVTHELLETWGRLASDSAGRRLLPYFDVPVQHVSGALLKSMRRRGDRASIDALFGRIRQACPDAVIRTSLIVGYPGETEAQFDELCDWVASGAVDRLGVLTYSDLPELQSHRLPDHVDENIKLQRQELLMEAQYDVMLEREQALVGTEIEVLLEEAEQPEDEPDTGAPLAAERDVYVYLGRSWRDAYEIDGLARVSSPQPLELYQVVRARVTAADAYDLDAEAL